MNLFDLFASLSLNANNFYQGIQQAQQTAGKFANDLSRNLSSNFGEKVGNALTSFGAGLEQVGNTIANVGKTASVVTAGVGAVLALSFNKAKQFIGTYESAMTVFVKKMGGGKEAATDMYNALVEIAKGSAYAQEHMVSAGQTLVAMGVSANDTKKYVQAATDAIAGFGGTGAEVEEMATLFAKISQQTNLYTQDIQSMVLKGIPAWDILATKYHTTTDNIKDMVRKGLIPAKDGLNTVASALEETNEQSEMFKYSVAGMAKELKSGTLTGTLDSLNTSFRTFALRLLDLDPRTESGEANIKKLNKAISKFGETLESLGKKFGFIGRWISQGLENVTNFLDKFNKALESMPQEQAEAIAKIITIIAASGPALLIVGTIISKLGVAIKTIGRVITWLSSSCIAPLIAAFGGLLPAIGAVTAIVVACIAVFKVLKDNWDNIVKMFTGWLEKTGLLKTFESIKEKCEQLWGKFSKLNDLFTVIGTTIMVVLSPAIVGAMGVFNSLVEAVDGLITTIEGFVDILSGLGQIIEGIFTLDPDKIKEGLNNVFLGVEETFRGFFDTITGMETGFWNGVGAIAGSFFETFLPNINEQLDKIREEVSNWLASRSEEIKAWLDDLPYKIGYALGLVIGTLIKWGVQAKEWVSTEVPKIIDNIVNWFKQLPSKIGEWLSNTIQKIISWGSDMKTEGKDAASDFNKSFIDKIKELPGKMGEIATNIVHGLVNGIQGAIGWVKEQVGKFANGVLDGMKSALGIASPSKLMRDEVGRYIAQGIGVGFSDEMGKVEKSMISDVDGLAKKLQMEDISYNQSMSGKANAGMVNGLLSALKVDTDNIINVYIGGKQIASEIYDPLMNLMRNKEVRINA